MFCMGLNILTQDSLHPSRIPCTLLRYNATSTAIHVNMDYNTFYAPNQSFNAGGCGGAASTPQLITSLPLSSKWRQNLDW